MRKKILVVDDDSLVGELLKLKLNAHGYDVAYAQDGEEALNLASLENPALIILDMMMPGFDGIEVLQQLSQNEPTRNTPVLILSARKSEEDIVAGLRSGALDYVSKPFMPEALMARVDGILARTRAA